MRSQEKKEGRKEEGEREREGREEISCARIWLLCLQVGTFGTEVNDRSSLKHFPHL